MAGAADFLASVDKSKFGIEPHHTRTEKPWGYEILLTADDAPYAAKIIHIQASCRLSLQAHDQKTETWVLQSGRAAALIETSSGEMVQVELKMDEGFTTQIGQKHRLVGITDCDIIEASTPELGTTWRLEDDYKRPDETEELRAQPGRGWK